MKTYKTDEELQSEVRFQLGWDSRVKQNEIGVVVRRGVVTLTGTVESYAARQAAAQAAHRVTGVLDVANEIAVAPTGRLQRGDEELARAVRHALDWNALLPASQIHATVSDGWVTLTGEVEFYRERVDAERTIAHLTGVRGVTNQIEVGVPVEPDRVKFLIEDVLELRADREAARIRVGVDEGTVTLTGAVTSWDEKKAILGAVSHAPGVRAVRDHLFIDPYGTRFERARAN